MALKLDFRFLDKDGNFLYQTSIHYATYIDDMQNLNFLHKKLKEHLTDPMIIHRTAIKYAVPVAVKDYMFDTDTFELLPNRFRQWKKEASRSSGFSRIGHNNT